MPINVYTVVSEFKFDVASAILGSEQLQSSVQGLSNTVNQAIGSVQGMGIGFMAQLSGLSGGLTGFLGSALGASDKFMQSQLSFTQIIDSNMESLTGNIGTLNEKMNISRIIMKDIANDARKFSVPAGDLLELTKGMAAMLVPKGLAGENFKGARDISRNMLKSAPNLGINPQEVQGQLLRAIEGSASMGDTLFRRLMSEAPEAFKANKVKDAKGFNQLDAAKRFSILNASMAKFASNSELLAMRANTMAGMFQRLKDLFTGFSSVLKPIGDSLMPVLLDVFNAFAKWVDNEGRQIIEMMAKWLKDMLKNPKAFIIKLIELRDLSSNFDTGIKLAGFVVSMIHLKELFGHIAHMPVIGPMITGMMSWFSNLKLGGKLTAVISEGFSRLPSLLMTFNKFTGIVFSGLAQLSGWLYVFMVPLMGLGRAMTMMRLESMQWLADNMVILTEIFDSIKESVLLFLSPLDDFIQGWADLFFVIIGGTGVMDYLRDFMGGFSLILRSLAETFMFVYGVFRGIIAGIMELIGTMIINMQTMIGNLMNGNFSDVNMGTENAFANFADGFMGELNKTFNKVYNPTMDGEVDNAKVSTRNQTNYITMNNSFKEVLQPDRIAFTIKDQLEKASVNKTSGRASGSAALLAKAI